MELKDINYAVNCSHEKTQAPLIASRKCLPNYTGSCITVFTFSKHQSNVSTRDHCYKVTINPFRPELLRTLLVLTKWIAISPF